MNENRAIGLLVILLVMAVFYISPSAGADESAYLSRPGTIRYAISNVPDGQTTLLDAEIIKSASFPFVFVRDPWKDSPELPVYADVSVSNWYSGDLMGYVIDIAGTMADVSSQRILIANQISIYTDENGKPFPMVPKGLEEPNDWAYKTDIPVIPFTDSNIPSPLDPGLQSGPVAQPMTAPMGTIANVKLSNDGATDSPSSSNGFGALSSDPPQISGGSVDLVGKVVTAVLYQSDNQTISSFYIQEPLMGGNGIKVVPQQPCAVIVGDIVEVTGTVIPSTSANAECYLQGDIVNPTGYSLLPQLVGMSQMNMACGTFGLQQALYSDSTISPGIMGVGLSPVGTSLRIWGAVTWRNSDGTICFIDDGSALKSSYAGQVRTGIRVIWSGSLLCTYQVGDYVEGITGILGAELSEDTPALPVPVIRISGNGQGSLNINELSFYSSLVSYCGQESQN